MKDVVVDSAEGIAILIEFARGGNFVLSECHKKIAQKYGVNTSGVVFCPKVVGGDKGK